MFACKASAGGGRVGCWFLVLGSWFLVLGSWFLVLGSWFLVLGSQVGAGAALVPPGIDISIHKHQFVAHQQHLRELLDRTGGEEAVALVAFGRSGLAAQHEGE